MLLLSSLRIVHPVRNNIVSKIHISIVEKTYAPYISPGPVVGEVVHVQDLLDRHQVGRNDGIQIRAEGFIITVEFREG